MKTAADSVTLVRWQAFLHVAAEGQATVNSTLRAIGRGDWYGARWELAALEAIGVVESDSVGPDNETQSTRIWRLAKPYQPLYESVASLSQLGKRHKGQATDSETPNSARQAGLPVAQT